MVLKGDPPCCLALLNARERKLLTKRANKARRAEGIEQERIALDAKRIATADAKMGLSPADLQRRLKALNGA